MEGSARFTQMEGTLHSCIGAVDRVGICELQWLAPVKLYEVGTLLLHRLTHQLRSACELA